METSLALGGPYGHGAVRRTMVRDASNARESLALRPGAGSGLQPRLLDLLAASAEWRPFEVPVGATEGDALWITLGAPRSAHILLADTAGPSRSNFLRSIAVGLAVTTRPSLLQILIIDLSGRELHPLESLPHAVAETASDPLSARLSLRWLAAEFQARAVEKRAWPRMLLVVDDLSSLAAAAPRSLVEILSVFLGCGAALGIHVLAGSERPALQNLLGTDRPVALIEGAGPPGCYDLITSGRRQRFTAATLPVIDLDAVARGLVGRYRPTRPTPPSGGTAGHTLRIPRGHAA